MVYNCPECGREGKCIYIMIFIVKDDSTAAFDKCYKIYFYSYLYSEFFGIKPTNLYKDFETRELLEK